MNRSLDYHIWLQVNTVRDPEIQGKAVGTNEVEIMAYNFPYLERKKDKLTDSSS